jgi:hypothetical protein
MQQPRDEDAILAEAYARHRAWDGPVREDETPPEAGYRFMRLCGLAPAAPDHTPEGQAALRATKRLRKGHGAIARKVRALLMERLVLTRAEWDRWMGDELYRRTAIHGLLAPSATRLALLLTAPHGDIRALSALAGIPTRIVDQTGQVLRAMTSARDINDQEVLIPGLTSAMREWSLDLAAPRGGPEVSPWARYVVTARLFGFAPQAQVGGPHAHPLADSAAIISAGPPFVVCPGTYPHAVRIAGRYREMLREAA